jgi:hypothetical protein
MMSAKLAEISRYTSPDAIAVAEQLSAALKSAVSPDIGNLLAAADGVLKAELQRVAADARRQAMLGGLAKLGYQVREGMTTDLARGQPVVLPKTSTPGFGLEMSANPNNNRMQLRVVAFGSAGAPRDKSRDRDIENAWCGDLDRLQAQLGSAGGTFLVERAQAAGAVALKVVSAPSGDASTAMGWESVTAQKPQTLPPRG